MANVMVNAVAMEESKRPGGVARGPLIIVLCSRHRAFIFAGVPQSRWFLGGGVGVAARRHTWH